MTKIILNPKDMEPIKGHTSKGDQPKWFQKNEWYKADHMGYESLAEVIISSLLKKSNLSDYVTYTPLFINSNGKDIPGCQSKNFRSKDETFIPIERLHRVFYGKGLAVTLSSIYETTDKIKYTVDFIEKVTGLLHVGPYLTMIMEMDAFFLNEDRHTNNIAVIRNEKTREFRLSPIFDNGLALLSDLNDYPLDNDFYKLIGQVQSKPFNDSFDLQMEAAEELYGSQLEFYFDKHDISSSLEMLKPFYDLTIIHRVENILLEQKRKYKAFFKNRE